MNTRERAARNAKIVEAKAWGATCREVAAQHGLSPRQVRRVWSEGADLAASGAGMDAVWESLLDQRSVLRELDEEIDSAPPDEKLGLIRETNQVMRARVDLLKMLGPFD